LHHAVSACHVSDTVADAETVFVDAGMNDHIAKPVDPEVLFATLAKYMQ
jgi:CheY-like chemotaxis protein